MKPTKVRNRQIFKAANHTLSMQLAATLSKDLRKKYQRRSARVVQGDTIKVLRGEFRGIEGKVIHVSSEKNGIAVEGIKREKLKGGNVDIFIHPSNVMITGMNLDDKWRQSKLERQEIKKEEKPAEKPSDSAVSKNMDENTVSPKPKVKSKKTADKKPKTTKEKKTTKEVTK